MARILLVLGLLMALPLPAHAATYFVSNAGNDSNPGSQAQPWQTMAKAFTVMGSGDTLYLRGGTYDQGIGFPFTVPPNGTGLTNRTTVAAWAQETVVLTRNITFSTGPTYSWLTFDRLILDGGQLFFGLNTDHIRFSNGEIKHCQQNCISGGGGFHEILNSRVHDAFQDGNFALYPVYFWGHDSLFEGNDFYDSPGYALHIYNSGQTNVSNNVLRNNRIYNVGFCGCDGEGTIILANGTNNQFYNNLVYGNKFGVQFGSSCIDCVAYNNTLYNNQSAAFSFDIGATRPQVRNNIAYLHPTFLTDNGAVSPVVNTNFTSDPAFADTASFRLQPQSGARNAGVTLPNFTTDFYATVRSAQGPAWDIGAVEYVEGGSLPPSGNPIYVSGGGHSDVPTDAGDCTVPENILTPRATLAGALACMQIPGKVLYIRGGTYAEVIDTGGSLPIVGGIAVDNPTRIEGYGNETVILALPVGKSVGLFLRTVSFVTVRKLIVDALGRVGSNAFACINADHLVIEASTFRNSYYEPGYLADCTDVVISQTTFHTSQVSAGVTLDGAVSNLTLAQVEIHTIPAQGLKANVDSGSNTNLVVKETQIHVTGQGSGGYGLDLGPGSGALIVNTIIDHNAAGVRVRSGASSVKVYQNAVASNVGTALQCDVGAGPGVTITNNIAFGNGTDAVVNNCGAILAKNLLGVDPLWVNIVGRDFHTGPTSPAIDMGDALAEVSLAIDGTPRPHPATLIYDAGPYETFTEVPPEVDPGPAPARVVKSKWLGMLY